MFRVHVWLVVFLFDRSEFLIDTSPKTNLSMCVCLTNLGFSVENTNLGFSVGYVLCASYVCTWYQPADRSTVPGTYVQYRATRTWASSAPPWVTNEVPFSSRCTTIQWQKRVFTGSLPPAVPLAITPTSRPWTHTSDDSYFYQLSLVLATATVSSWENKL